MSDEIFLRDLRIDTIIGIYDWERRQKQTISIDVRMPADIRRAAATDSIDDTLNYKAVAKRFIAFTEASSFLLVETLAESLADIALSEFDLPFVDIRVNKPGAIRGAQDVGVRIVRGLSETPGPHMVYVSLGSNIEPRDNMRAALRALTERFDALCVSPVYRTASVGFVGDDFFNMVAGFPTSEPVDAVLEALSAIEQQQGRERGEGKFSSRTLDLDLLLYGDAVLRRDGLALPRPEMLDYAFMLRPLADVAGHVRDPLSGRPYAQVWSESPLSAQPMETVSLDVAASATVEGD